MKRLNYQSLLNKAGQIYRQAKKDKGHDNLPAGIISDQVKTVLQLFVEEINLVNERIDKLEKTFGK